MNLSESVPPPERTPLRLATWNLNHWRQPMLPVDTRRAAWEHLATAMGVRVALVQEAVPPLELDRDRVVYGELAGHRNWGSAVVALDPAITLEPLRSVRIPWSRRRYLLENANPGSVAIARMTVPGIEPITLVSVYGVVEGMVVSSVLRVVADLMPLFDSPYGARVILGGDLNVSRSTSDPKQRARADAVLAAILSLGLVEASPRPPARSSAFRNACVFPVPGPATISRFLPGAFATASVECAPEPRILGDGIVHWWVTYPRAAAAAAWSEQTVPHAFRSIGSGRQEIVPPVD